MAALSKLWTVKDFYARVAGRCQNVENFILDEQSLMSIARMEILSNFAAASSAMRKYYQNDEDLAVVTNSHISLTGKNYFDITEIAYGATQTYHAARSMTEFTNVQNSLHGETLREGRYWFWQQGKDRVLIFQGSAVVTAAQETTLKVHHIRYPDLTNMTLDAARAGSAFMDIPDWSVPFFYLATAVSAIKEQNLAVPANLANEVTTALSSLSDRLTTEEMEIQKQRLTNLTR